MKMLIENQSLSKTLKKEHGLSIYVESLGRKILFDTGASSAFIENSKKMNINLEEINMVVISHAHIDHCGGLLKFLEINRKAMIYIHSNATKEYYLNFIIKKNISVPKDVFLKYSDRICFINDAVTQLDHDLFLISKFNRHLPLIKSNKSLLQKIGDKYYQDEFNHEIALVLSEDNKLIIFTGCGHNGVDNMIETILPLFTEKSIKAIIGGFHLMSFFPLNILGKRKDYIINLSERLADYNIDKIYTCHCTGYKEFQILKKMMKDEIVYFSTGESYEV